MNAYVTSTIENGIGTIEFFHPQSNSMPSSQLKNLIEEIEKLGQNIDAKVIICFYFLNLEPFQSNFLPKSAFIPTIIT